MAQSNFQILVNGGTVEAQVTALVTEAEDTGKVPEVWAELCPGVVLGLFQAVGQERLPEDVFATAMFNLQI